MPSPSNEDNVFTSEYDPWDDGEWDNDPDFRQVETITVRGGVL